MPRYALELEPMSYGSTFRDAETTITWRVETVQDAPEPFLVKLACAPDPSEPSNLWKLA